MKNSVGPLDYQTWRTNGWPLQKLPKIGVGTHTTALSMFVMVDCSLLATAHDCETGFIGSELT